MNDSTVITRFAPSPTGFLHIGGARTALFNWLFAKHHGGRMLLRIEDTDRERSTQEAVAAILDGLSWLGLTWDGDPVYQHTRLDRHGEVAGELLAKGHAYRCYCSPDELTAMRERARAEGRAAAYEGTWRDRDPADAPRGIDPVIRFKAPRDGQTIVDDKVQGRVEYANDQLDDLIILRSDGTPTYNLSVVVDDHDMGVTHVIRGDDHLTNAARQSQIYDALAWQVPAFAHIPLIHGQDGAKLSKRHGALGVAAYRAMGYLPAALRNYLVRLGWSHGDDEIISTDQMIEWFGLDAIGRSPARFDFDKLDNLNAHYLREATATSLIERAFEATPYLENGGQLPDALTDTQNAQLALAFESLRPRAKKLGDLISGAAFLFASRPLVLDEKAAKLVDDDARVHLKELRSSLSSIQDWTVQSVEEAVRAYADSAGLKLGKIAQPLRAATTGTTVSPGIFEVLAILGKDEVLDRIDDQTG